MVQHVDPLPVTPEFHIRVLVAVPATSLLVQLPVSGLVLVPLPLMWETGMLFLAPGQGLAVAAFRAMNLLMEDLFLCLSPALCHFAFQIR